MTHNTKNPCNLGAEFEAFKCQHATIIDVLAKETAGKEDELSCLLDDHAADLKSMLGANAANECSDDLAEQESAINEAEEWVADNIANSSIDDRIAGLLWLNGAAEGALIIQKALLQ